MHVLRKELCIRLAVLFLVVVGLGYYGAGAVTKTVQKAGGLRAKPISVKTIALPSDHEKDVIATGIALVRNPGRREEIPYLMPSLVEKKQGRVEMAKLTMLVQGQKHQYAMINNRMYREGDTLPDGRKVTSMDSAGVLLSALGTTEILAWVPPLKVELKKSAPAAPAASGMVNATNSVENPVSGSKGKMVIDADKALQLIKQLETVSGTKK
ncbi:MAG: hypothetical protein WC177_05170 [Bacilli bacterium]